MSDRNQIMKSLQCSVRREMGKRGISLKMVAIDSGISYSTLTTWFPTENNAIDPVTLPMWAVYAFAETRAIPDDLLSAFLPDGCMMVRVPEGIDHDELEKVCRDYLAEKGATHHPESENGREISPGEQGRLNAKVAVLRAAAA